MLTESQFFQLIYNHTVFFSWLTLKTLQPHSAVAPVYLVGNLWHIVTRQRVYVRATAVEQNSVEEKTTYALQHGVGKAKSCRCSQVVFRFPLFPIPLITKRSVSQRF